jgi:uncharacterized protein DUF4258
MSASRLVFRVHAIQRMFQRQISNDDVRHVLENGETIEGYPKDTPYPSRLVLGWCRSRPLHVVVADNPEDQETIVITVYEPDLIEWEQGFRRRKRS